MLPNLDPSLPNRNDPLVTDQIYHQVLALPAEDGPFDAPTFGLDVDGIVVGARGEYGGVKG